MSPALLCGAHELLLGTAVSLPHCPLVLVPCVPGAWPSSAAEEVISSLPGDIHGSPELAAPAGQQTHHCKTYFKVSSINQHAQWIPEAQLFPLKEL